MSERFGTYTPSGDVILHHTRAYLDSRPPAAPVHLVQYDDTLPVIAAALYAGEVPYTLPAGGSVNIRMGKPDGTSLYNPALGLDEGRHTVYIQVTPQMTALAGDLAPILEVTAGGGVAGTSVLALKIAPNPVPAEKIQSADEYRTVQQLAAQASAAAAAAAGSAQTAQDSAAAAGSAQAGAETAQTGAQSSAAAASGARAGAETAQTNAQASAAQAATDSATAAQKAAAAAASAQAAQEAAEQAQQVAQGAKGFFETPDALRAAYPTGQAGWWAIIGSSDSIWVWDVEGAEWVNSGQSIELSDYYTKAQTDALLAPVSAAAQAGLGRPVTIPVPVSGWQGGTAGPWTNAVPVEGVTALTELSNILPAAGSGEPAKQAALQWQTLETGVGTVTLTANAEKPTVDFTLTAIARQTKGAENAAE